MLIIYTMKLLFSCLLVLFLIACSSSTNTGAIYHSRFDFASVVYYSTYERNSDFSDKQNISYIMRNGIEIAIDKSMADQGFEYSEFNKADIIVTYHIIDNSRREYSIYNEAVLFCEYCLRANTWHTENKSWHITPGSLILDLINPKNKRSVWRSVYPLEIKDKDNSRQVNDKIQQAIKTMLLKYPRVAFKTAMNTYVVSGHVS